MPRKTQQIKNSSNPTVICREINEKQASISRMPKKRLNTTSQTIPKAMTAVTIVYMISAKKRGTRQYISFGTFFLALTSKIEPFELSYAIAMHNKIVTMLPATSNPKYTSHSNDLHCVGLWKKKSPIAASTL